MSCFIYLYIQEKNEKEIERGRERERQKRKYKTYVLPAHTHVIFSMLVFIHSTYIHINQFNIKLQKFYKRKLFHVGE